MGLTLRRWALLAGLVLACSAWVLQAPDDGEVWKALAGLFAAALTAIVGLMLRDAKRGGDPTPSADLATVRSVKDAIQAHEERERIATAKLAADTAHEIAQRVDALKAVLDEREKRYDERKEEVDARHATMLRMLDDLGRRLP